MAVNMPMLKLYAQKGYNVLFSASHGVGKTAITKAVFDEVFGEMGKKWLYFSASTLDPWVDLVGVPHPGKTPDGQPLLELLRPQWVYQDVEGIFFDEINRAPDKVRNALMELIQFKSINGFKLSKLKSIWAAENPWDEESTYSVSKLDPAQRDRFQIQIELDNKPDTIYFRKTFPDIGPKFLEWWNALSDPNKKLVSPRRLEDAILVYRDGGDLKQVLPAATNVSALMDTINKESIIKQIQDVLALPDDKIKEKLTVDFVSKMHTHFGKVPNAKEKVYDLIPDEVSANIRNKAVAKEIKEWKDKKQRTEAAARVAASVAGGPKKDLRDAKWANYLKVEKLNPVSYGSTPNSSYLGPWRALLNDTFSNVASLCKFIKSDMNADIALRIAKTLIAWQINVPFSHAGPSYKDSQKIAIYFALNVYKVLGLPLTQSEKDAIKKRFYSEVDVLMSVKAYGGILGALNATIQSPGAQNTSTATSSQTAKQPAVKMKSGYAGWSEAIEKSLIADDDVYKF